ncbi:MAG: glycosyltransferase, partial [Verrucomicrobia bacterium]|nr:glycosyltransferase [Verrucomicrobiota bacterium]
MENSKKNPLTVIACGGSGGHFYPGLSVARKLYNAGCDIILVVTEKEVDQVITGAEHGIRVERMPAVGFSKEHFFRFFI